MQNGRINGTRPTFSWRNLWRFTRPAPLAVVGDVHEHAHVAPLRAPPGGHGEAPRRALPGVPDLGHERALGHDGAGARQHRHPGGHWHRDCHQDPLWSGTRWFCRPCCRMHNGDVRDGDADRRRGHHRCCSPRRRGHNQRCSPQRCIPSVQCKCMSQI